MDTPTNTSGAPEHVDLRTSAFLLDIDGTLLEIAPTPNEVHVSDALRASLACLREKTSGAVALVSGRLVANIDELFAPLKLSAVGGHGAEIRLVTDHETTEHGASPLDEELRRRLRACVEAPGVLIEDKGYSMAVHYRLAPERQQDIHAAFDAIEAEFPPGTVEVLAGKAVVEIKKTGFNKGTAIREVMRHPPFAGRTPIFIGDDVTDEAGFAAMHDIGGVAMSVGRIFPGLAGRFDAPADVRHWLEQVCGRAHA